MKKASKISKLIAQWYTQNKRDLPWRETTDPYKIWLSEIILQQTRVEQGLPYYHNFLAKYPNVDRLAQASEDAVLKLWQGLGYYSRARNLHSTAKHISLNKKGKFPGAYDEIIKLKGIGNYTASAIASFAFGEPKAVVDGNVIRVISRLFGITTAVNKSSTIKHIQELAAQLLDTSNPAAHNQAMMDFGSLQCIPRNPDCSICPLNKDCLAQRVDMVHEIPFKPKAKAKTNRFFNFLILQKKDRVVLERRDENDIWAGLYQFPLLERVDEKELSKSEIAHFLNHGEFVIQNIRSHKKHILSHQNIFTRFYHIEILDEIPSKYNAIKTNEVHRFALPRLIDKYLESHTLD